MSYSSSLKGVSFGPNWLGKTLGRRWDLSQALRRGKLRFDKAGWNLKSIPGRRKGMSTGTEVEIMIQGTEGTGCGWPQGIRWWQDLCGLRWPLRGCGSAEGPCHMGQHRQRRAESEKIRFEQHEGSGLGEGTGNQWRRLESEWPQRSRRCGKEWAVAGATEG